MQWHELLNLTAWDGMHKKGVLDLTSVGMHAMACMIFVENDGTSWGGANQYPTGCWFGGRREGILQVSNWLLAGWGGVPTNIQLVVGWIGGTLPISNCLLDRWGGVFYQYSNGLVGGRGTLPVSN